MNDNELHKEPVSVTLGERDYTFQAPSRNQARRVRASMVRIWEKYGHNWYPNGTPKPDASGAEMELSIADMLDTLKDVLQLSDEDITYVDDMATEEQIANAWEAIAKLINPIKSSTQTTPGENQESCMPSSVERD